jgi:hypothetical protein
MLRSFSPHGWNPSALAGSQKPHDLGKLLHGAKQESGNQIFSICHGEFCYDGFPAIFSFTLLGYRRTGSFF